VSITLPPQLEALLTAQARGRGVAPEVLAVELLQQRLQPATREEWERRLSAAASDCGVSLSDEQVSREGIYD
jgi:hypothetical protein